jgi:hypothetical protein
MNMHDDPPANPASEWGALNWELKRQARGMPMMKVEAVFDDTVQQFEQSGKLFWPDFIRVIADGFKQMARREYVYRTRLRAVYEELLGLKKKLQRLERYEAALLGFDDTGCIDLKDIADKTIDCVYIVRDIDVTGFYKIGVTNNLYRRFNELTKMPFQIGLVCVLTFENVYMLEARLHDRFREKRIRGEWFNLTQEDIAWIKATYIGE